MVCTDCERYLGVPGVGPAVQLDASVFTPLSTLLEVADPRLPTPGRVGGERLPELGRLDPVPGRLGGL